MAGTFEIRAGQGETFSGVQLAVLPEAGFNGSVLQYSTAGTLPEACPVQPEPQWCLLQPGYHDTA